jgi:hypothetical protein
MDSLIALNVSSPINYGTLALNTNTGTLNKTATVTNTGNRSIDANLSGTAMSCTIGTIAVGQQEYSASSGVNYGAGTDLTGSPIRLVLTLPQPTEGTAPVQAITYWGLGMPATGVGGSCLGTNTFGAVGDL